MIDFACKKFDLKEIIKCGLGLSKADCNIMMFLMDNPSEFYTTEKIASKLGLNLSTAQRAVKKLTEKGILLRLQNNLHSGGYEFAYKIKDKKKVREIILDIVKNWVKKVEEELEKW